MSSSGEEILARTFKRADLADQPLSLELPPGAGYTAVARFFDEADTLVAEGISHPFDVSSQQVVSLEVSVTPVISSVAGTGLSGYSGDGGPASEAQIFLPMGMASGADGALFLADASNHVIRRIDADGTIRTVAGTKVQSPSRPALGDNGPVITATLSSPNAVALAPNGDLFIADTTNRQLRVIAALDGSRYGMMLTKGNIYTLFASSVPQPNMYGLAVDQAGNAFVGDRYRLMMHSLDGQMSQVAGTNTIGAGGDGPALESALCIPDGLVVDPVGNVLFSERSNHRIRMLCRKPGAYFGIEMASGSVYTIAGVGQPTSDSQLLGDGKDGLQASFNFPRGIAMDKRGNLFIVDSGNQRIRILSPDRRISTFAGTGERTPADGSKLGDGASALKATFWNPVGVLVSEDTLYISDSSNHRVRKIRL
jgi:sugar lactone lactonase YvrE